MDNVKHELSLGTEAIRHRLTRISHQPIGPIVTIYDKQCLFANFRRNEKSDSFFSHRSACPPVVGVEPVLAGYSMGS